jgi:hypothetical protein
MSDTIKVGSRLTTDLALTLDGRPVVIAGVSHPTADGMAVTEGVPAAAFRVWLETHADSAMVSGLQVFELPADFDATPQPKEYGHEPALRRLSEDAEQRELAERGAPDDPEPSPPTRAGLHVPVPADLPPPPAFRVPEGAVPLALNDGGARPEHVIRASRGEPIHGEGAPPASGPAEGGPSAPAAPMDHPSANDLGGVPNAPIPQVNPTTPPVS